MDEQTQLDGENARIRQDYGTLDSCVEYMATVLLCWGKRKYREQKEVVKDFLQLQASGLIPWYVTLDALKAWIISREQNVIKERFQIEDSDRRDGLVFLTWEVNLRLKLQEIERACKRVCGTQSPHLPGGQDPHLAALRDLQSEKAGVLPASPFFHCHFSYLKCSPIFNARAVVQQAVKDIMHKLAYQPASCQRSLPDVVVEVVARLCQVMMDEDGAEDGVDARLLSSMAVGTAVSVLHAVRADLPPAVEFSPVARDGMVACIYAELQRSVGTPQALWGALCTVKTRTTAAIATTVSAAVRQLCSGSQAFSSCSVPLPELRGEAIAGSTEEKEDDVAETLLEVELSEPRVNDGAAEPQVDDEVVEPWADDEVVEPQVGDEVVEPQVGDEVVEPQVDDEVVEPQVVDEVVEPQVDDEVVEPQVHDEVVEPQVDDEVVEPLVDDEVVKPQVGDEVVEPQVGDEVVEPQVGDEVVEPQVGDEVVEPQVDDEVVEPQVGDEVVEPQLDDEGTADLHVNVGELREMPDGETQGHSDITMVHASPSTDVEMMEPGEEAVTLSTEGMDVNSAEKQEDNTPEALLSDFGTPDLAVDAIELGTLEDPCVVDAQKEALGDVEVDYEPGDLPQKVEKKSAVRRFFGRVWKSMKRSMCCCVSVGEE